MITVGHVDMHQLQGSPSTEQAFRRDLIAGLKAHGFVTLSGHGIDLPTLRRCYAKAAEFFALPDTEKRRYAGALRGYTPFGVEHAKDHAAPDLKEFWQIGHPDDERSAAEHPNIWPDRPDGFRDTFETLFNQLFAIGKTLLNVIADEFELEKTYFDTRLEGGTSLLRLLHYPPIPEGVDPACIRAAAHEDINLITLLVAAEGSGLELLDRNGNWLPINNAPDHLVVDTGDMMARITNGVLPATTHRVVNPAGPNVSRYSMPFFVQPRSDVILSCLPACEHVGQPEPPVTVGEFLGQRLKEIGLPDR
jgi:isopenicillin N synthase-like dioxygenase